MQIPNQTLKKQNKAIEEHGKQLAETNGLVNRDDFDTYDREKDSLLLLRQKEKFTELCYVRLKNGSFK